MTFFDYDTNMNLHLEEVLAGLEKDGRPGLHNKISINWIRYNQPNPSPSSGKGASWSEERLLYPASVVKLAYAIATEAWIQKDLIQESDEIRRALKDMIVYSSNDATGLILDLLTGTTSGPSLFGDRWLAWKKQRNLVNEWLKELQWPELNKINCCQKTWNEGPYGRERDFYGAGNENRNALSTAATSRILEAIMTNTLISPPACKRLQKLLSRSLDLTQRKANPENQIDGFLGENLPKGTQIWSKAGWMSQARHDAAWFSHPQSNPMLLVVFTQGRQLANDRVLLPTIGKELVSFHLGMQRS